MLRTTLITAWSVVVLFVGETAFASDQGPPQAPHKYTVEELRARMSAVYGPGGAGVSPPNASSVFPNAATTLVQPARAAAASPDEKRVAARDRVLRGIGIDAGTADLLVFVSTSMPDTLIKAYAREAMWAGGTLIVRGIPAGMTIQQFVNSIGGPLVRNKGASASLQIDPRMYDRYAVTRVPTIVWDEHPLDDQGCDEGEMKSSKGVDGRARQYRGCKAQPADRYYAMTGSVTIGFALDEFAKAGAKKAEARREQMAQYVQTGGVRQSPFAGDWGEELPPFQEAAKNAAYDDAQDVSKRLLNDVLPYFESQKSEIEP